MGSNLYLGTPEVFCAIGSRLWFAPRTWAPRLTGVYPELDEGDEMLSYLAVLGARKLSCIRFVQPGT